MKTTCATCGKSITKGLGARNHQKMHNRAATLASGVTAGMKVTTTYWDGTPLMVVEVDADYACMRLASPRGGTFFAGLESIAK